MTRRRSHDAGEMLAAHKVRGCPSPSPELSPSRPSGHDASRSVSSASWLSYASRSDMTARDSLGSDLSSSRHSSASYLSHQSDLSNASHSRPADRKPRRRGYVRPQGTDFAASARSRESVMSLGSIAHLQYYFARTGLLDGKGAQLARRKHGQRATLDMALLGATCLDGTRPLSPTPLSPTSCLDASAGAGTAAATGTAATPLDAKYSHVAKTDADIGDDSNDDSLCESDSGMLPPTVSTYNHKQPQVPKPPTIAELKADLQRALDDAAVALAEVQQHNDGGTLAGASSPPLPLPSASSPPPPPSTSSPPPLPLPSASSSSSSPPPSASPSASPPNMPPQNSHGWYELQGMHILDVVTLAIRAAKMYYTAHELPDRLDSIKPEKQVRADLLAVMETLKQMATRNFRGGMRDDEVAIINGWIKSILDMLAREADMEAAERAEQASWSWLAGDWSGRELQRERAFLVSMDPHADALPEWQPLSHAADAPTPFLRSMQNGLRLVKLHNAAVHKSRRRFGAIPVFHVDTQKPYRCADNLRYWVKAAELRFEVLLHLDVLAVVYGNDPQAWFDFEAAILKWCRHVRQEIARDLGWQ